MRLKDKVALISGGARGMGAVEAKLFTQEGARVFFGDILDEEGKRVEADIREQGGGAAYLHLDVTVEPDWRAAMNTIASKCGKLDILVNNAGIVPRYSLDEPLETITEEQWDRVMEVNAKGVFLGTKYAIPLMRLAGRRVHRQYIFGRRHHSRAGNPGVICGKQRRRAHLYQVDRYPIRQRQYPVQLRPSGPHRYSHAPNCPHRTGQRGGTLGPNTPGQGRNV